MVEWIFLTCYALVIGHELDAIQQKEWRIFPGTNLLPDQLGFRVFTALHVPLFMLLNWLFFFSAPRMSCTRQSSGLPFLLSRTSAPIGFFSQPQRISV